MIYWRKYFASATLVLGAVATVWWSVLRGRAEQRTNTRLNLGAAPLVGRSEIDGWVWRFGWGLIGAVLVAVVVALLTRFGVWWRWRQRWVLLATGAGAALFAAMLALTDGLDGLRYGADHETEYLANLDRTPGSGEFVRTFVERINRYSVHVRGHPPGYVLLLKVLAAIGLRGVWPVVVVTIVATGVTAAAVLLAVRAVAGDDWMRRAAPLLIVAPYAIWMVTSGDAVFACVGALGIAAAAEGCNRERLSAVWFGLIAGLMLGCLLFLSYLGAVLLLIPSVLIASSIVRKERGAVPVVAAGVVGGLLVVGAFWIAGFWWFDGVAATKEQYHAGSAQFRDWSYFAIGNIGAAAIALGPATIVGLGALRNRRVWLLVGAAAIALTVAHLSRYTKGEVERIWLIFFPWIAVSSAAVITRARRASAAIVVLLTAAYAIVLEMALVSKW